jgi:hypothetical protein
VPWVGAHPARFFEREGGMVPGPQWGSDAQAQPPLILPVKGSPAIVDSPGGGGYLLGLRAPGIPSGYAAETLRGVP